MHACLAACFTLTALLLLTCPAPAQELPPSPRTFTTSAYRGSLARALEAVGDQPAALTVDVPTTCDAPLVPAHVSLTIPRGGLLILGDQPLQIAGTLSAGRYPIFAPTGTVTGLRESYPEWFGAGAEGLTDDTSAVQRALDAVGARQETRAGGTLILTGRYAVTSLLATHFGTHIHSENAWLVARPGEAEYLLRFSPNAHSSTITGKLFLDLNHNLGYGCAINVNARHFISHNVEIWRAPLAWLFGDRRWATSGIPGDAERGDSEIEIIGGATPHCLRGVEAVGANTIIKFTGVFLYSFPWTLPEGDPRKEAWESADCTLIRVIGALVYMDSGGIANFNTSPMIDAQPIATTHPEYHSEYGKVFVNAAHVEAGNFFATSNPHGIVSRGRSNSLSMIGCNGYLSSDNPVIETDPLFTGGVVIQGCGFYRFGRTSPIALIGNPEANVNIDSASFWDAGTRGLDRVRGGTQVFTQRLILHAKGVTQELTGEARPIGFGALVDLPDGRDFAPCFDAPSGVFTCPTGGLRSVNLRAAIALADGQATDISTVLVMVNGEPVFSRKGAGFSNEVDYTIGQLKAGDRVWLEMGCDPPRAMDPGPGTCLQITASRL